VQTGPLHRPSVHASSPISRRGCYAAGAVGACLASTPAEYGVTGVKSFIVSHDGVVYEKDFGPATLNEFIKMDRFNTDRSWKPILEE
jgi:hypothetical protein